MSSKCPKCFHSFTLPNHLPLILPSCLHHLCSSCVNSSHNVKCSVITCQDRHKQQEESLLVYDCHMLGKQEVKLYKNNQNKMQQLNDSDAQFPPSSPLQIVPGSIRCSKCRSTLSEVTCTTCRTIFCPPCFTSTHSTPVMSTHTGVQYQAVAGLVVRECQEHSRKMEFVSVADGKLGCSHCAVLGEMRGRKVVDLHRVEREILESGILKNKMDKLNTALGRCQSVKKELHSHSSDDQSAKDSLEFHLNRCHRMLEVVGGKMMAQLRQKEEEHSLSVGRTQRRIDEMISRIEMLLEVAECQYEDESGDGGGDRINLIKLLEEMGNIYEDDLELDFNVQKSPVVKIDQSIFNVLSNHIAIDLASVTPLAVRKVHQDELSGELLELLDKMREEKKSMVEDRIMREHFSGLEEVSIMHVESPESFYVMRKKDRQLAQNLESLMENEWKVGEKGKVEVGDMVVVNMEGRYSRVSVTKIIPGNATVTYPDQGQTTQAPLPSLVSLSANLSLYNCPHLAHHCSLASYGGTVQVGYQAARAVQVFGMGSLCRVAVVGRNASISQSTMLVNITKEDDEGNTVSLLDYLVYHNMATRQPGGTSPQMRVVRTFPQLPSVKAGTELSVIVVQVNSPVEMFVIMENNAEDLVSLLKDLQAEYEVEAVDEQMILLPVEGMVCVARFSEDGRYYRAMVTGVMGEMMVGVVFVDFGSTRVLEVGGLRRIKTKFLEWPVMAVKVGLVDVQPVGKLWSEEATDCVRELVRNKVLRMVVVKEERKALTTKVMLCEWNVKEQYSVNHKLVHQGHAKPMKRLLHQPDLTRMFLTAPPATVQGMRTACRVVTASSPAKICIRRMCQEESFYQLCRDLSNHFSSSSAISILRHWHEGAGCVIRLQGEGWVRAKVVREEEEGMVEVFLVDYGVQEIVGVDSIRKLPDKFSMSPFCWSVHLTKIVPAGDDERWAWSACEKLRELLGGTSMVAEIQLVGEIVDGSWPVEMFIQEIDESAGPLDPEGFISKSVGSILKEEGLAIQPRNGLMTQRCSGGGGQIEQGALPSHGNNAGIGESIVEDILKDVLSDVVLACCEESQHEFQWLEAVAPTSSALTCSVSHVDWDCNLYISTIPDNQETLRIIQSVLQSKYAGSTHSQEDLHWTAGEACIAQFHLDKMWYRGMVLKVLDTGECIVKFVDYGSEERCKPANMRKGLFLTEVPVQCFTVQMEGVRPITEHWTEDVLDFLHKTVVDQVLRVNIIQARDTFPLPVNMFTKSGLDIGKMLVRNGYARGEERINA